MLDSKKLKDNDKTKVRRRRKTR